MAHCNTICVHMRALYRFNTLPLSVSRAPGGISNLYKQIVLTRIPLERSAGIAYSAVHSLHLNTGLLCSPGPYNSPLSCVQTNSCLPATPSTSQKLIPCCLVGLGKHLKTSATAPESKSSLRTHPTFVIRCTGPSWPGFQDSLTSYRFPLAAMMSPVTLKRVPRPVAGSVSMKMPSW